MLKCFFFYSSSCKNGEFLVLATNSSSLEVLFEPQEPQCGLEMGCMHCGQGCGIIACCVPSIYRKGEEGGTSYVINVTICSMSRGLYFFTSLRVVLVVFHWNWLHVWWTRHCVVHVHWTGYNKCQEQWTEMVTQQVRVPILRWMVQNANQFLQTISTPCEIIDMPAGHRCVCWGWDCSAISTNKVGSNVLVCVCT